jgi:hypothetical protein
MSTIGERLKQLSDAAAFTMVDMAAWCEYDKSAMREWIQNDVEPHPIRVKHLTTRLDLLEKVLKKSEKLPIPIQIKQYQRKTYVEGVRNYALGKFSKAGSSKHGV